MTPGVGQGPTTMAGGETRYLGTWFFTVDDCAAGDVSIGPRCSPSDTICDNMPEGTNTTRFRDDVPGMGLLIPVTVMDATLTGPWVGTCCMGLTCLGERPCQVECQADFPGSEFFPGRTCAEAIPCGCQNDGQCDDTGPCNGIEACDFGTGDCMLIQPPPNCNDGDLCTNDSCDADHPQADPLTGCVNEEIQCDDGAPCNGVEACDPLTGQCFLAEPAPACEDGDACTIDICDVSDPHADPVTGCVSKDFGKAYWAEGGVTHRAAFTGGTITPVLSNGAESLAIDTEAGKLYWTAPGLNKIQRSNLDGSNVEDLITSGPGSLSPWVLALDPPGGKMYWFDGSNRIFRADLTGANIEVLLTFGFSPDPGGIVVDHGGGKMYWTDGALHQVRRANLNGTSVEVIVPTMQSPPVGIGVVPSIGKVYWTTTGSVNGIWRANLNGTNVESLISGLGAPRALAFDRRVNYIPTGSHFNKIYWTESTAGRIQRSALDGTNVETIVSGIPTQPRGIALDLTCCQLYGDVFPPPTGSGVRDFEDILCVLAAFMSLDDCPSGDMAPCGGNGKVDVDDVLAILDTYNLVFACPANCP